MIYLKNFGKSLLYILVSTLIFTLIVTVFSYFNIVSDKTSNFFLIILTSISMIIGGFMIGKKAKKKRWLDGLKLGFATSLLFILYSIVIFKYNYKISSFIYYIILIISSIFGSILGIRKKET